MNPLSHARQTDNKQRFLFENRRASLKACLKIYFWPSSSSSFSFSSSDFSGHFEDEDDDENEEDGAFRHFEFENDDEDEEEVDCSIRESSIHLAPLRLLE